MFLAGMAAVNRALAEQADRKSEYLADLNEQLQAGKNSAGGDDREEGVLLL